MFKKIIIYVMLLVVLSIPVFAFHNETFDNDDWLTSGDWETYTSGGAFTTEGGYLKITSETVHILFNHTIGNNTYERVCMRFVNDDGSEDCDATDRVAHSGIFEPDSVIANLQSAADGEVMAWNQDVCSAGSVHFLVGGQDSSGAGLDGWNVYCWEWNSTNVTSYINGVLSASHGISDIYGAYYSGGWSYGGTQANYTNGFNFGIRDYAASMTPLFIDWISFDTFALPPILPIADLIFRNESDIINTTFGEGEEFITQVNYTLDNGTIITNETGNCTINFIGGFVEIDGDFDNFTLCDSGCNFSSRKKQFNFSIVNAVNDSIHFDGCHEQTASGNMELTISCGILSETLIVLASEMPLCSVGTAFIRKGSDICIGGNFNISTNTSGNIPFSQRKRILNAGADREYSVDVNEPPIDVIWNNTINVFQTGHLHEYYDSGIATITANCTTSLGDFDINVSENITIINVPPVIFIEQFISPSNIVYNITDGIVFEFENGTWTLIVSVIDTSLDEVNVSVYNSSALIFTTNNLTGMTISSDFFVDFGANPFSINVTANDTFSNETVASLNFNFTDISPPTITFNFPLITGDSVVTSNFSNFNVTVQDENLYSIYVNITDCLTTTHRSFSNTSLNGLTTFDFFQQINFSNMTDGTYCERVKVCDGHTNLGIDNYFEYIDKDDDSITYNNKIKIRSLRGTQSMKSTKLNDRYQFTFETTLETDYLEFIVTSDEYIDIINSKYIAHLITGKYWIDFENDAIIRFEIIRLKDNEVAISLWFDNGYNSFKFSSIGELNCDIQEVTFSLDRVPFDRFIFSIIDITLEQGFFLALLFLFGVFMVTYGEYTQSVIMIMLSGIYFALYGVFLLYLSPQFAIMLFVAGILISLRGIEMKMFLSRG